jgi:hypothetical protein
MERVSSGFYLRNVLFDIRAFGIPLIVGGSENLECPDRYDLQKAAEDIKCN